MKKLWIVALCLVLTFGLVACGGNPDTPVNSDPVGGAVIPDEGTGTSADAGTTTTQQGNVVDGDAFFGGDTTNTTTTTTKKEDASNTGGTTTTTQGGNEATIQPTTSTTAKPTTTVAPPQQETVQKISLPAAGYDMDGKGRILVKKSEVKKENKIQCAYITFENASKKNGKEWIIPEYSQVQYACYDKDGKQVGSGTMVLGALDGDETVTCKIELPDGTAEIKLTGHNFEYWTPWA